MLTGFNALIIMMVWTMNQRGKYAPGTRYTGKLEIAGSAILLGLWAYALLTPGTLGDTGHQWAASLATGMCAISKLPQAYAIYAEVGTGALSLTSILLLTGVSMARLATLLMESSDTARLWA